MLCRAMLLISGALSLKSVNLGLTSVATARFDAVTRALFGRSQKCEIPEIRYDPRRSRLVLQEG